MSLSQSHKRCDISHRMVTVTTHDRVITSNMRTMRDKVYSYNSSYIYSVENQIGTLLSSPCQLRLGG